jgi:hypothetical protein
MKKIVKTNLEKILYYAFFLLLIIGVWYILHSDPQKRLKNEPNCFTKTISIDFSSSADGLPLIDYKFKINDKIFVSYDILNSENQDKIKDTMTVRYICNDPNVSELVFDEN